MKKSLHEEIYKYMRKIEIDIIKRKRNAKKEQNFGSKGEITHIRERNFTRVSV